MIPYIKGIRVILMDVDGVLTDGKIILGENEELKVFHVRDGMGIKLAKSVGIKTGIITSRESKAVERRAKELGIDYLFQGIGNKTGILKDILDSEQIDSTNICYIGDDINDIPVFRSVGFSATVADAPEYVKSETSYISTKSGGTGAIREIIEYILRREKLLQMAINKIIEG